MSISAQPFTSAALAGHYFRRLPTSWRDGIAEIDYAEAALAIGKQRPAEAAANDRNERWMIRRESDPSLDAAERRHERRSIRELHAQMRITASRRPHERRISKDGRSLIFIGNPTVTPTTPATRSREQGHGRRTVRTSSSSPDDPGGDPAAPIST